MTIALIDTSIFCELLEIPGKAQDAEVYQAELKKKTAAKETLLLPITTVIETGNFIGHLGDGKKRRFYAEKFVGTVLNAINGTFPFTPTPFFQVPELTLWLGEFTEWVKPADRGFGDLTITKEWERQCALHKARRVYIWSKDAHLAGYDREP